MAWQVWNTAYLLYTKYIVVLDSDLLNYLLITSNVCTITILQFSIKQRLNEDLNPVGC